MIGLATKGVGALHKMCGITYIASLMACAWVVRDFISHSLHSVVAWLAIGDFCLPSSKEKRSPNWPFRQIYFWKCSKGFDECWSFIFSPENSTIAPGEVNTILFISKHDLIYHRQRIPWLMLDVMPSLAHWIFPSKVNMQAKGKYSLTLDNFSFSSQQLVLSYILYPCKCPDVHLPGILA